MIIIFLLILTINSLLLLNYNNILTFSSYVFSNNIYTFSSSNVTFNNITSNNSYNQFYHAPNPNTTFNNCNNKIYDAVRYINFS